MILQHWSKKATFATLITVCVLGSYCFLFWDIKFVTSTPVGNWTKTQTERLKSWFSNKINTNVEEEAVDEDINSTEFENTTQNRQIKHQQGDTTTTQQPSSMRDVSQNTTLLAKDRSTTFPPDVFFSSTTMTFNNTLVVDCKQSPYTYCYPPNVSPITKKIFKIVSVRQPEWFTSKSMNLTNCKIDQCVIEKNSDINNADIVTIHGVGLRDNFTVPRRRPGQLYAIEIWESPVHTHAEFIENGKSPWNGRINIIISYRLDGDAFFPYNRLAFKPKPLDQRPNYYDIAKRKTRTAVWLVSNCWTPSRREQYVREMQKYIDIDIFGNCGIRCNKTKSCDDWATKYKFYLAFENSLCTDYVTEKFFKIFYSSIYVIPVVRGGADYDKHFPNFTYINSAHFKTPKDLALHLKHLASDLETYSKYLEYKDLYTIAPYLNIGCKMCTFLHTHKLPHPSKTYNLTSWLGLNHCHNPTDLQ